jgi:hypothetical protein
MLPDPRARSAPRYGRPRRRSRALSYPDVTKFLVERRTVEDAVWLLEDVQARVKRRIQLTTDNLGAYLPAIAQVFWLDIDFASFGARSRRIFAGNAGLG